jgi:hypothetical protein
MGLLKRKGKGLLGIQDQQGLLAAQMDHPLFTPPNLPGVEALQNYMIGVKDRISHPLEAAAKASQDMMSADPTKLAMDWANPGIAMVGATAYHGSPHLFDKFKMDKIGTGEGAQAYGHGLYFAENHSVAKSYGENLSRTFDSAGDVGKYWRANGGESAFRKFADTAGLDAKFVEETVMNINKTGNIYKVDIPDSAIPKMLDWDKPLSQQSPEVQAAIKSIAKDHPLGQTLTHPDTTGGVIYKGLSGGFSGEQTMQSDGVRRLLQQQGIPGIKYLDGGSRGTGQGTSNFVLFDENLPKILERNGQPVKGLLSQ